MSAHLREHPRFIDQQKVEVSIADRAELHQLWTADISKGGMFIECETPPPNGTQLQIRLATPDGSILLNGRVVHVLDAAVAKAYGQKQGIGVAFVDLSKEVRAKIERYVDGIANRITSDLRVDPETEPLEILLEEAKRIASAIESADLYRAIGVEPDASTEEINAAVSELLHRFSHPPSDCPPPKAARLMQISRQIEKTGALFSNPLRRLHYDFHHGHVRAKERAAAGQDLEYLRTVWSDVFPERVDKARELMKRATSLEGSGKIEECIKLGTEALENDPFNAALSRALDAWRSGQKAASLATPREEKNDDASRLAAELAELHRMMGGLDHFQLLGVDAKASTQDVARAYLARKKRFDPEVLQGRVPPSVVAMAEEYMRALALAYHTLSDGERRRQYVATNKGARADAAIDDKEQARIQNEMGLVFLRKNDFAKAREMFEAAMALAPQVPDYGANLAWALIIDPRIDRAKASAKARPLLVTAIDKSPGKSQEELRRRARYHYYLGRLCREQGALSEAIQHLEQAVDLNPRLAEAATELRLIKMRQSKK